MNISIINNLPKNQFEQERMAEIIARFIQQDGDLTTAIPELLFFRQSKKSQPMPCIYNLGFTMALQGKKKLIIDEQTIEYGCGESLLTTIDLPLISYISEASQTKPYLGLLLKLDQKLIAQIASEMNLSSESNQYSNQALSCQYVDDELNNAFYRLLTLLDAPKLHRDHLSPIIQKEIYIRLLTGPHGGKLLQIISLGSPIQKLVKIITWIKQNYHQHIDIDSLAKMSNMSISTFRLHFRSICGVSPLQYIKQIRLQEAKKILLTNKLDTAEIARQVGYESHSQFTREYKRLFGNPPLRDLKLKKDLSIIE